MLCCISYLCQNIHCYQYVNRTSSTDGVADLYYCSRATIVIELGNIPKWSNTFLASSNACSTWNRCERLSKSDGEQQQEIIANDIMCWFTFCRRSHLLSSRCRQLLLLFQLWYHWYRWSTVRRLFTQWNLLRCLCTCSVCNIQFFSLNKTSRHQKGLQTFREANHWHSVLKAFLFFKQMLIKKLTRFFNC